MQRGWRRGGLMQPRYAGAVVMILLLWYLATYKGEIDDSGRRAQVLPVPHVEAEARVCDVADIADRDRAATTSVRMDACPAGVRGLHLLASLPRLRQLDLSNAGLTAFPPALAALGHPSLEVVLMQNNPLGTLPDISHMAPRLIYIGLRACGLTAVDGAHLPPSLLSLVLTNNRLTSVTRVDALPRLRKLMLSHNRLAGLPRLPATLELLRVSNNPELAGDAVDFGALPALAWVAVSGTRIPAPMGERATVIDEVPRSEVDVDYTARLGGNAGGDVFRGTYRGEAVAVKYYKAAGSDGTAADEVNVLQRLKGEGLLTALAVLAPLPPGQQPADPRAAGLGVVFPFLERSAKLGGMPTFHTVVRDTSPATPTTPALALAALRATARALQYLHGAGFAHGDLYAHNILWQDTTPARVVVSDFGAAWAVPAGLRDAAEAAEVRAFGVLAEDVLEWCGGECAGEERGLVERVVRVCTGAVGERPRFGELVGMLGG